jgi:Lon protease-like protein
VGRAESHQPGVERLALFPLNVVLFPGGLLPLRIFEPRYLRMVSECMRSGEPFVVAAIVDGPETGGAAQTAQIGTLARIIDWEQHADGLLGLLCEGEQTVAIGDVAIEPDQLARAMVSRRPLATPRALPHDMTWLADLLDDLLRRIGPPFERLVVPAPSADHVGARLIELLPLPLAEKQALLEMQDGVARLRRLAGLIDPGGTGSP